MSRRVRLRLVTEVLYLAVAYAVLFFYADNYFCSAARGQSRPIVSAKLALACTTWDVFASLCGTLAFVIQGKSARWIPVIVATVIVGVGLASMPFWINRGYGRFLFENTWADVSCFFTEGNGLAFPFVVAPALMATTLIRESFVRRMGSAVTA